MRKSRKVGNLRLKDHRSPRRLREQGMDWLRKAVTATNNAHALFALAELREREADKEKDAFYRAQHLETCEQCRKGGLQPNSVELAFHMAHLSKRASEVPPV